MTKKATQRSRGITRLAAAMEDPVDGPELGWAGPPTKDPKVVTEDQDLEVLGAVISATLATANEETGERLDDEVQEREHRLIERGSRR